MKYPQNQFEILVKALRVLKQYIDVDTLNLHSLHFLVYQQFSEGQIHNYLVLNNSNIERNFIPNTEGGIEYKTNKGAVKVIDFEFNFELYPNDTNDNHIETAMKKALKSL